MAVSFSGGFSISGGFNVGQLVEVQEPEPELLSTTWNPDDKAALMALSNGDLTATLTGGTDNIRKGIRSILGVSSGKYYWEITTLVNHNLPGIALITWALDSGTAVESNSGFLGIVSSGAARNNVPGTTTGGLNAGSTNGNGTVVSMALDLDNGKMWISATASWPSGGDPSAGLFPYYSTIPANTYFAAWIGQNLSTNAQSVVNFGQNPFTGVGVPEGFTAGFGTVE